MGKLDGKVAIITGAARGQGEAHVRLFVEEGAKVVFSDILVNEGEALAKELGDNVRFIKHDISNADDWSQVVELAESVFGPVNILVNNAGVDLFRKIEDITVEEYNRVIRINQVGPFLGMKAVLPSMKKAGSGSIVNISSINGLRGEYGFVAYDSSKFALTGMTKTAAQEFAEYNIRVNSVHPGPIKTPMIESQDEISGFIDGLSVPLNRVGEPEEVSKLVLFVASDDASYSTGSEFVIDGGITASN
ncbi:SDR family NAD(P)-dependent oxidoreductase [Paenibacillus ihbetae]|uniref:3-alpha-hydroxysteroid dehydrogenase n=1 Tax=Paenibacillus ihbetae TaxID=1870820 RepID=A0ABX3JZQ8_9BACL|nr:glucose 1-dehydrogenase [Paenibacillus ihbetae]OOC62668.1 3-alpha-hydroxysteroid dehydrogenase [Paenibacillus ihbetae]